MSTMIPVNDPFEGVDLPRLEKSLQSPRTLFSSGMSVVTGFLTLAAAWPLFSVLYMLIKRGGARLFTAPAGESSAWEVFTDIFTQIPPSAMGLAGGFGNAVVGTMVMVGIGTMISVPFGILGAVFLAEVSPRSKTAAAVRFCAKMLTGFPSILSGVFVYAAVVLTTGGFSAPAGGVALALLMLPTIMLTSEESLRMVPAKMREAAIGMGCTSAQLVGRVLLPTAMPGILTGVMLSVARAAGETAPLIFTALFSTAGWAIDWGEACVWWNPLSWFSFTMMEETSSLANLIFKFSFSPSKNHVELAWAASLVLVFLVLLLNIGGQLLSRRAITR